MPSKRWPEPAGSPDGRIDDRTGLDGEKGRPLTILVGGRALALRPRHVARLRIGIQHRRHELSGLHLRSPV